MKRFRCRPRPATRFEFQALERRVLLTAVIGPDGTPTVNGTSADDTITVTTDGTNTTVTIDNAPAQFLNTAYTALVINGGDGNDNITVGSGLIGATVNGGNGDDTINTQNGTADTV